MKKYAFAGIGVAVGFVSALALFPAAQGATNVLSAYRELDLFGDAFERVRANYVREVDDSELINAAINGMVSSLDPHSSYMDPKEFADMQVQTRGEFGGLGLEVTQEDGLVKVVTSIDDTPAAHAGIKTGDYISAIDGTSIQGMPLNDAVERMRGPENSKVTLTILRTGEKKPLELTLTRAVIRVESVKYEKKGDVGYIRITSFSEKTDAGVKKAVADLKKQLGPNLRGYVLDLRNDPGGLLDQAIAVSDDFLTGGEIVSTRGRKPEDTQRYNARAGDIADGKPIVVLVNEGTASASEIVAGALQDHKRATVIGVTSFGKGSVQTIIPLGGQHGGALRLTTARYYTPSGRSIQATGIAPDIAVSNLTEKEQGESDQFAQRTEASLAGHLDAEGAQRNTKMPTIRPEEGKKIDDFQLSYALDRIDGKVVALPVAQKQASTAR
ncbi:MAG TPA: S41 family peptidase [Micropepsaceae bacterium]|nr:S41 family peptidase [Micropepsaceae bacterium]